jgi:hypothetical protein
MKVSCAIIAAVAHDPSKFDTDLMVASSATFLDRRRCRKTGEMPGAANRTRTCDPVITNDVLYQLSYCGEP